MNRNQILQEWEQFIEELVARQDRTCDMAGLSSSSQYEVPLMDAILHLMMDERPNFLLDIGCKTGHRSNFLATRRLVLKCLGVDLSELAVAKARRFAECFHSGAEFLKASCTELPVNDGSVDYALSVDVIPWIKGWQQSIAEVGRVLEPYGKLLLVYNYMPETRSLIPAAEVINELNHVGINAERFDVAHLNAVFVRGRKRYTKT